MSYNVNYLSESLLPTKKRIERMIKSGDYKIERNFLNPKDKDVIERYQDIIIKKIKSKEYDIKDYVILKDSLIKIGSNDLSIFCNEFIDLLELKPNKINMIIEIFKENNLLDINEECRPAHIGLIIHEVILTLEKLIGREVLNHINSIDNKDAIELKKIYDFEKNYINLMTLEIKEQFYEKYKEVMKYNKNIEKFITGIMSHINEHYQILLRTKLDIVALQEEKKKISYSYKKI